MPCVILCLTQNLNAKIEQILNQVQDDIVQVQDDTHNMVDDIALCHLARLTTRHPGLEPGSY